jgi:predicted PurR-regulated permease PerM
MAEAGESRFYARVFGLVASGLLALALLGILKPFLASILWAGLLAFLVAPLNALLTRKLGGRPGLAALLLTMAGALFVLIPAVVTAIIFAGQATELMGTLERLAERYKIAQPSDLLQMPALDQLFQWIGTSCRCRRSRFAAGHSPAADRSSCCSSPRVARSSPACWVWSSRLA